MSIFEKFPFGKKKEPKKSAKKTVEKPPAKPVVKKDKALIREKPTELPSLNKKELGPKDEALEKSIEKIDEKIKTLKGLVGLLKGPESVKNDPKGVRLARECYIKAQTILSELNMLSSNSRYEEKINMKKEEIKNMAEGLRTYLPKIIAAQNEIMAVKSKEDLGNLVEESRKEVEFISEKVGTEELPDFDAEDDLLLELRPDLLKKKSNELGAGIEKTGEYDQLQKFSQEAKVSSWF